MTPRAEIRLLTYNVRSLRDDEDAVARVIRSVDPDVVCVQEAPRFLRWRSRCARVARLAGLVVVTGGRLAAGNLVLASLRTRVVHAEDALFPRTRGRLHGRGAASAVLEIGNVRIGVVGVHLGLDANERARHLDLILAQLEALHAYGATMLAVAGDLNETPDRPVWQRLASRLPDAYVTAPEGAKLTFPAARPRSRIDGVFTDAAVLGCGVPALPEGAASTYAAASDHRPVLARLLPD